MAKILQVTRFGNPLLRTPADEIAVQEITEPEVQELIANIRYTVAQKRYGVGLAAPQVGILKSLSVIAIKPTPSLPDESPFESVIINPIITETFGKRSSMWEGCISCGSGKNTLFGKALRYKKIRMQWLDEYATAHDEILEGLPAHVAQHEVDHLNGILFVDQVRDAKTYMMLDEYKKRVVNKND